MFDSHAVPYTAAATMPETKLQRPAAADKYAVIDVGGTQHLVEEGRWYTCNRLQVCGVVDVTDYVLHNALRATIILSI